MIDISRPRILLAALCALTLSMAGCGASTPTGDSPSQVVAPGAGAAGGAAQITPEARAEAQQLFATRCTPCHGMSGGGDGVASAGLNPHPRNFHDKAWQGGVTDEHIEKIIQFGGAAVGKSPAMPANPDLMSKPAVVAALREHVRSLAQ